MALTVSMMTDPTTSVAIATITGDTGDDDLIVDIAETLSAVADGSRLFVDIADTEHLSTHHLAQLLEHTPDHVIIIHPSRPGHGRRVATSIDQARARINPNVGPRPHGGDPACTS